MTLCVEGIWRNFENRLPIVIYTGNSFMWPAKLKRCVPSDMTIKGTSVSPSLSADSTSVSSDHTRVSLLTSDSHHQSTGCISL